MNYKPAEVRRTAGFPADDSYPPLLIWRNPLPIPGVVVKHRRKFPVIEMQGRTHHPDGQAKRQRGIYDLPARSAVRAFYVNRSPVKVHGANRAAHAAVF